MSAAPGALLVPGFAPIGLEELNDVGALQVRVDRKYLVAPQVAARLLDGLPDRTLVLTIDGLRSFDYDSTYLDTGGLDSYLRAARRRKRRWKIRERVYVDTGTNWLEVKTVRGERTVKERMQLPGTHPDQWGPDEQLMIDRALGGAGVDPVPLAALIPVLRTRYRRTTLFDPTSGARLTLDERLSWSDGPGGRAGRLGRTLVVETKSPGSTPSAADRVLWRLGSRPVGFSKYATGMALLDPGLPHNRWHRTMGGLAPDLTVVERAPRRR